MTERCIAALRSIDLGAADAERSLRFYADAWGLEHVSSADGVHYLRARGAEHHAVSVRQTGQPRFIGLSLAAASEAAVDGLWQHAQQREMETDGAPRQLEACAGGGYGFTLTGPEGLRVTVSHGGTVWPARTEDPTKPYKLTHVVINSADVPAQKAFFMELLGFRLSDSTQRMEFLRCGTDHHSIALAYGDSLSLNHAAFEMNDIDTLMYGAGRMIEHGYPVEWGLGRHGPGNNVFSYFIDPDGFVVEYTTDVQQIDESRYVPQDADYWGNFPKRPCRWGVARKPSDRLTSAMAGKLISAREPDDRARS